jgi:hypothetical protein
MRARWGVHGQFETDVPPQGFQHALLELHPGQCLVRLSNGSFQAIRFGVAIGCLRPGEHLTAHPSARPQPDVETPDSFTTRRSTRRALVITDLLSENFVPGIIRFNSPTGWAANNFGPKEQCFRSWFAPSPPEVDARKSMNCL